MTPVQPQPVRKYAGRTPAERTSDRRETLLAAAFDLVAELGWGGLRIDTLCRRANLNKRYFYESFENLDEISQLIVEQLADETITATTAALEDGDTPEAQTHAAITAFVTQLTDDPRRARVLFGAIPPGEVTAAHRLSAVRRVIAAAASAGAGLHHLPNTPPVRLAASLLVGGTAQSILDWLDGGIACDREELVTLIVAHWQAVSAETLRQLGAEPEPGR